MGCGVTNGERGANRTDMRPFATWIYVRCLAARGLRRKAWLCARAAAVRLLGDPPCAMTVHGRTLRMPLSHPLPDYLTRHRFYDRLPRRLADFLRRARGCLAAVDVGANIGDTLAALAPQAGDRLLAIEADPTFFDYLQRNWGNDPRVTLRQEFCGAACGETRVVIREQNGSATITPAEHGRPMRCATLDALTRDTPFASGVGLLKIDTDGHEFEVLEGARDLLRRDRPALLIECDARGDPDFGERCAGLFARLATCGYHGFLVYDNYGLLMGRHTCADTSGFRELRAYQQAGGCYYFDLLVMDAASLEPFAAAEAAFFARETAGEGRE